MVGRMKNNNWIWMGHAGHLCVSHSCSFHLNTYIGKYIVSTVGEYYPSFSREKMVTIGAGDKSFYETMVFKARRGNYSCCPFEQSGDELDMERYETAGEAQKGHLKLCNKWSRK